MTSVVTNSWVDKLKRTFSKTAIKEDAEKTKTEWLDSRLCDNCKIHFKEYKTANRWYTARATLFTSLIVIVWVIIRTLARLKT